MLASKQPSCACFYIRRIADVIILNKTPYHFFSTWHGAPHSFVTYVLHIQNALAECIIHFLVAKASHVQNMKLWMAVRNGRENSMKREGCKASRCICFVVRLHWVKDSLDQWDQCYRMKLSSNIGSVEMEWCFFGRLLLKLYCALCNVGFIYFCFVPCPNSDNMTFTTYVTRMRRIHIGPIRCTIHGVNV